MFKTPIMITSIEHQKQMKERNAELHRDNWDDCMILFWTLPYCFKIFPGMFGYVRGMRSGFLLEMKSWLHETGCFQKRSDDIADEEEADDLESWWGSRVVPLLSGPGRGGRRRLQSERGTSCWNMRVEQCWMMLKSTLWGCEQVTDMKWVLRSLSGECQGTKRPQCQTGS